MSDSDEAYYANMMVAETGEEQEYNIPSEAIKIFREKKRMKRDSSQEFEQWKRMGIEARQNRRRDTRSKQLALKAKRLAQRHLLARDGGGAELLPKAQLQRATAFFQRMLEHLYEMEQTSKHRGKQIAIKRELDASRGNATGIEEYTKELQTIRDLERENRRVFHESIFELPENWNDLDNETLLTLLHIRGNVKNVSKLRARETIVMRLRESFSKPLF